jgi:hypothetical protein
MKSGMTITEFILARIAEDEREANVSLDLYAEGGTTSKRRWIRVLAQCKAMRQIVDLHHEYIGVCGHCVDIAGKHQREAWPCETVRTLAAIWSDHPDYDDTWRP